MKRKIRKKDGTIVEVDADYVLKDGEEEVPKEETPETPETPEETPEEDTKAMEKMEDLIGEKIEIAVKNIYDNPVGKSPAFHKEEATAEKSVMETDPYLRSKRPFVKLSKKMEDFVVNVRTLALGGNVKTMGEDDDTTGGFLVPEEFQAEVVRYTTEKAVIRPRARVFTMARDTLTLPKLDQSSNRFGGATAYWKGESVEKEASEPAFGKITLRVKKLIGLCPTSDELLADSVINLANYLVSLFGEVITYEEDYRFIRGTGMLQPLGMLNTAGINQVGRNTSSKIVLEDIIGMYVAHPAWADANAVWLTTKAGMGQLLATGYNSTGGVTLFMMNLRDKVIPILQGKPVLLTEKLPALGSKGDIILADLNYYYIGDRGGLKVDSSIHDRFRYDETTFRFVKRFDGQPAIASAFTVLTP